MLEEPVAVVFAALAVARFVGPVAVFAVVLDAFAGDLLREDTEVVEVPRDGGVVACSGGVVGEEAGEGFVFGKGGWFGLGGGRGGWWFGVGGGHCVGMGGSSEGGGDVEALILLPEL